MCTSSDLQMSSFIGPSLPPGFKVNAKDSTDSESDKDENDYLNCENESSADIEQNDTYGPVLPPNVAEPPETETKEGIQPLPNAKIRIKTSESSDSDSCENENDDAISDGASCLDEPSQDVYGPALPPGFKESESKSEKIFGPRLPEEFSNVSDSDGDSLSDSEEDEPVIGPTLPMLSEDNRRSIRHDIEYRSKKMKDKLQRKDEPNIPKRESWMTELPEDRSKMFGLEPRTFKRKVTGPEHVDRSEWTDTPSDTQRKLMSGSSKNSSSNVQSIEDVTRRKRDEDITKYVSNHNKKKRSKSLLNIHESKRKKEAKSQNEPAVRQSFDREKDLKVNRFDEAQKKSILKKARALDSRFSHSSTSSNFL